MARKNIEILKIKLLSNSANTCNVCRDNKEEVIVHHIDQNTSNNKENNLIVLCIGCHAKAHTKHKLSLNLTPSRLNVFKARWELAVKNTSTTTIKEYKVSQQKEKNKEKSSKEEKYIQKAREEFKTLDSMYKHNFDESKIVEIDKKMIQLFSKYKNIISKVYDQKQLKKYIDKIENTPYQTKQTLRKEILEKYFIRILDIEDNRREHRDIIDNNEVKELVGFFPDFNTFIKKYRQNYKYDEKTLSSFFNNLYHHGVGFLSIKHENILCNFKDEIKEEMLSNYDFFSKVINLIEHSTRSSDTSCLKNIILELENQDEIYKKRMNEIKETNSLFEHEMNIYMTSIEKTIHPP